MFLIIVLALVFVFYVLLVAFGIGLYIVGIVYANLSEKWDDLMGWLA